MTTGVDDMPDGILCNILSRLPVKPMVGRCRCVSKLWNALISDPSFMMSRSPLIFLESWGDESDDEYTTEIPIPINPTYILDESVTHNLDDSLFNLPASEYDRDQRNRRSVTIVGTFSGIILLVVNDFTKFYSSYYVRMNPHIILYNPTTSVYDILDDDQNPPLYYYSDELDHAYGFGYGATIDELRIVRFGKYHWDTWNTCDVLNLKTRSWSHPQLLTTHEYATFKDVVGTFLKGYLYWIINTNIYSKNGYSKIVAFDVDKMVFSEMHLPDQAINNEYNRLGTCHGCLWMITNTDDDTLNFDVWVMNINDQGVDDNYSWSKTCSFTIGLEGQHDLCFYRIIKITDDGRIIIYVEMDDCPDRIIYYDTSKHSYKLQDIVLKYRPNRGIIYKESLVSPMNICRACLI
uniref:F-box/kelch-repeat protein At3g06240-like n=1 Tax=Erigeron canadensis TaxID=72917 RepID=UPI001CB9570B|nr:F-box/kelch-repeat protein At3g06240-like [Erigeron canadensis]